MMTTAALGFIKSAMDSAGIPYEFMEFTSDVSSVPVYWVGSYSEVTPDAEDGEQETQFILTGTGKGTWLDLERQKATIERLFPMIGGTTAVLPNGDGIAVFYGNAFPVPTGEGSLKRLQVNLIIKEWKVN